MAQKFLTDIDLTKNELQNAVLQVLATAPSAPVEGQVYYNSTDHTAYQYNGVAWVPWDATKLPDGSLVLAKLAVNPLARANHTGTQTAATISDFDAQVRTSRLDQMAAPTADVSLNSRKLTALADPTANTDAANKQYVDQVAQSAASGIDPKESVKAATTANITLSGAQTIDGVSVVAGDRVLVKDQTTDSGNGVYIVASGAWARAADATTGTLTSGALVLVLGGTTNGGTQWYLQTADPITVGSTALSWVQFGAGATYSAGNGLTLVGSTFSAKAGDGVVVDGNGINVAADVARTYAAAVGDGSSTSITVTHNLGTRDVLVQVFEAASPYALVLCDVEAATTNTVTLGFNTAPASGQYRVKVVA